METKQSTIQHGQRIMIQFEFINVEKKKNISELDRYAEIAFVGLEAEFVLLNLNICIKTPNLDRKITN